MNLSGFFLFIFAGLLSIYLGFKPLHLKQQSFEHVPQFELESFTLYELDKSGLITLMSGEKATKYNDYYEVKGINYTDNSKHQILNMKATQGLYKDEIVTLSDGVELYGENDFSFHSETAKYDKKKNLISTDVNYTFERGDDHMSGTSLKYYPNLDKMKSTNVEIIYQLKEELK